MRWSYENLPNIEHSSLQEIQCRYVSVRLGRETTCHHKWKMEIYSELLELCYLFNLLQQASSSLWTKFKSFPSERTKLLKKFHSQTFPSLDPFPHSEMDGFLDSTSFAAELSPTLIFQHIPIRLPLVESSPCSGGYLRKHVLLKYLKVIHAHCRNKTCTQRNTRKKTIFNPIP